jgi:hypothetical protein
MSAELRREETKTSTEMPVNIIRNHDELKMLLQTHIVRKNP